MNTSLRNTISTTRFCLKLFTDFNAQISSVWSVVPFYLILPVYNSRSFFKYQILVNWSSDCIMQNVKQSVPLPWSLATSSSASSVSLGSSWDTFGRSLHNETEILVDPSHKIFAGRHFAISHQVSIRLEILDSWHKILADFLARFQGFSTKMPQQRHAFLGLSTENPRIASDQQNPWTPARLSLIKASGSSRWSESGTYGWLGSYFVPSEYLGSLKNEKNEPFPRGRFQYEVSRASPGGKTFKKSCFKRDPFKKKDLMTILGIFCLISAAPKLHL